jgi:hypothetical protein
MAKVYLQCHCCKKVDDIGRMEILQDFEELEDIKDENIICKSCFADQQDCKAYTLSHGEFTNYEDYMRSQGATIAGDIDYPRREE